MSQAERHAKQTERMTAQARELAALREKLAPKPMAVYVASLFPFFPWRDPHAAHWVAIPNRFLAIGVKV